jgi:homospermidine synthase
VETCVEVNTADVLSWCLRNGRHFTNTVCDMWREQTYEKTNHYKNIHGILRDYVLPVAAVIRDVFFPEKAETSFPSAMIGMGANIGMVNHYFKKAMTDASKAWGMSIDEIGSQLQGVYIFEKDTIVFKKDFVPQEGVFYNTWNVLEFHLESVAHVDYPPTTTEADDLSNGVLNVFYDRAMNRDITLNDVIVHGRVVSHEETYSIADYCHRRWGCHPEVQFIYECSPIGEVSRIKYPLGTGAVPVCVSTEADPDFGSDLVGTLIILKDGRAWSTYFDCAQDDITTELKEFTNATAWYVSCGVLSSILFIREHPQEGPGFPEDFDSKFNEVVARNFERFVTSTGKGIRSQDETSRLRLTGPYPTYECENRY